ncbi:DUF397 domain-containing protein [Streptomyces sp. XD-27]|uniref:DUF397 domain-containing protein n=1 Tax=Streptomyces sp. XD-27 TaxID=3062779 RepID=UPI0026F46755|nr:DUF397 domain-containing protein [Streptomyces sp. XD-27]WKX71615.1 DUF397 domain-containing protein [Streptomyces sp. XD-27]
MNTTELAWFKSSYSGDAGGACIEVALDWHKSTYSGDNGGACVEVATCPHTVHVRDSKDKTGPTLSFSPEEWTAFVAFARVQAL